MRMSPEKAAVVILDDEYVKQAPRCKNCAHKGGIDDMDDGWCCLYRYVKDDFGFFIGVRVIQDSGLCNKYKRGN